MLKVVGAPRGVLMRQILERKKLDHLYLASTNPGKLREFRQAAALRNIRVEPVPDIEHLPLPVEDGVTFEENARKKALHYSHYMNGAVFADDSGICVDVFGGAPGVHSARFAGIDATDEANNQKLLAELRSLGAMNAPARYVCAIALAQDGRVLTTVEGRADGLIVSEPRGSGGFGYDPHFYYPALGRTFAELSADEKFAVSHRGEAFRKLLDAVSGS